MSKSFDNETGAVLGSKMHGPDNIFYEMQICFFFLSIFKRIIPKVWGNFAMICSDVISTKKGVQIFKRAFVRTRFFLKEKHFARCNFCVLRNPREQQLVFFFWKPGADIIFIHVHNLLCECLKNANKKQWWLFFSFILFSFDKKDPMY